MRDFLPEIFFVMAMLIAIPAFVLNGGCQVKVTFHTEQSAGGQDE